MLLPRMGFVPYQNERYTIEVGIPPKTREFPDPAAAYLVKNNETGVTEYFDSVLYRAKESADQLRDLMDGKKQPDPWQEMMEEVRNKKGETFQ